MFATTLPILFAFTTIITPLEFGFFLVALLVAVYFITPTEYQDVVLDPYTTVYLYLHAVWLGHMTLWRTFWPFFILLNAIFFYIDYRIAHTTFTISSWKTVHSMIFFPLLWWIVGVWRCSAHTSSKYWASAARTVTLYIVIELMLRYIIATKLPHLLFNCRLLTIEFGDC